LVPEDSFVTNSPIYSAFASDPEYASDPEFGDLLEEFVSLIPERIRSIREAIERGDKAKVSALVHQLRGACGSYGFHQVTPFATELEVALKSIAHLSELTGPIEIFLGVCGQMKMKG
jgi:HPt (histidine-containing phosphotransfer) domain-containing protein